MHKNVFRQSVIFDVIIKSIYLFFFMMHLQSQPCVLLCLVREVFFTKTLIDKEDTM